MTEPEASEMYRKHRPRLFKDVLGQPETVAFLQQKLKDNAMPHFLLFVGPSGTGKTTIARILRTKLRCADRDFHEINAAESRGIDMVRSLNETVPLAPWQSGGCKIWLVDEAHKLTGDAQASFLKKLEDPPSHVYFIMCTTETTKMLPTLLTRATKLTLKSLSRADLKTALTSILTKEKKIVSSLVIENVISAAEGSARLAVNLLDKALGLATEAEQLQIIAEESGRDHAQKLVFAMMNNSTKWKTIAELLEKIDGDEESVFRRIMDLARSELVKNRKLDRAYTILDIFHAPFYGSDKNRLVWACAEVSRIRD